MCMHFDALSRHVGIALGGSWWVLVPIACLKKRCYPADLGSVLHLRCATNRRKNHAFGEYFLCLKSIVIQRLRYKLRRPWLWRFSVFLLFKFDLCITSKITLRDKRLAPMIQPSTAALAGLSVFLCENRRE